MLPPIAGADFSNGAAFDTTPDDLVAADGITVSGWGDEPRRLGGRETGPETLEGFLLRSGNLTVLRHRECRLWSGVLRRHRECIRSPLPFLPE